MDTRNTRLSIRGNQFFINDAITYAGRVFRGYKLEGLLLNARLAQGIFDDMNSESRSLFDYPDGPWCPDRNTREFIDNMPIWRSAGMLAFNINLQGGSPRGYSEKQPWHNSAFDENGALRTDYMLRLEKILDRADALGMVVNLGYFYFGQDQRFKDEASVVAATKNATDWIVEHGYTNLIVEVANEIDNCYDHEIISRHRGHELIELVKTLSEGRVANEIGRLYVGTSYCGCMVPDSNIVEVSDVIFVHGNESKSPDDIRRLVKETRSVKGFRGQPIFNNEDDHFDFEKEDNNFIAAISEYSSWGYFDYRKEGEPIEVGFQCVPIDWSISTDRKKSFFNLVAEMTGSDARF